MRRLHCIIPFSWCESGYVYMATTHLSVKEILAQILFAWDLRETPTTYTVALKNVVFYIASHGQSYINSLDKPVISVSIDFI